jgi:hypothetical protein
MGQGRIVAAGCALACAAAALLAPQALAAAAPPFLSADHSQPNVSSTYGGGNFGRWFTDAFGLPAFRYETDEATDPKAKQPELGGQTWAQHQLGNDHIVANAYNDGYVQFWSQDRLAQWANLYDPAHQHFAGGFGWLDAGGKSASTLYLDRPQGAPFERDFGTGYYRKRLSANGIAVTQDVYSPFGDAPLLLDDVTLKNTTA